MARNVDGANERNSEVPKELRVHERRHEATRGRIDVDMNVQPLRLVLRLQQVIEGLHHEHLSQQSGMIDE